MTARGSAALGAPSRPRSRAPHDLALDTVGVLSTGLWRLPHLATFLGARRILFRPNAGARLDAIVGWGHKPSAEPARRFAATHGIPYLALEDGFLRSVGLGPREAPLSLVLDDQGIYYDARSPSRLETWLAGAGPDDPLANPTLLQRAASCRRRIVETRISKYNQASTKLPTHLTQSGRPIVLVVDQTYDDAAVTQGLAGAATFDRMLEAARDEHPDARILVKTHPATIAGNKRGYLTSHHAERLADDLNPHALLAHVAHVYVVSSQLGFEALMAEKPVSCFGAPFYAGWGLTRDHHTLPRRHKARSLDELVAAALLLYPRYRDPFVEALCEAERIIEHLALQRRMRDENARAGTTYCVGFSTWKRPFVRRYLASDQRIHFLRSAKKLPDTKASTLVVWGRSRSTPPHPTTAHMEDGFLRSVSLGSQLTPPGSLVLDRTGLYYDPTRPSDLEHLLEHADFTPDELARAARLRQSILDSGISKYNLASLRPFHPRAKPNQSIVLVIGQVDDDASVRLGSPLVRSNLALVSAARRLRPDAHLVYKPHPDVLSGNRRGHLRPTSKPPWDELVEHHSVAACLAVSDEVHTMTSLVGFEALLRDIRVVTHGIPFYAGWGLTTDRLPSPRRTRRLDLDELVAGTLLRYPRYYNWRTKAFCTAEDMVAELTRMRDTRSRSFSFATPWLMRRLRDIAILSWEWLHA